MLAGAGCKVAGCGNGTRALSCAHWGVAGDIFLCSPGLAQLSQGSESSLVAADGAWGNLAGVHKLVLATLGPELARLDQCTHPWPPRAEGFICLGQAGGVCVCLKSKLLREAFVPKQARSGA